MTTPTQAQIEAAAKALAEQDDLVWSNISEAAAFAFRLDAKAALTAAQVAQVDFLCPQCGARGYIKDGATTTTAAAQVGEQPNQKDLARYIQTIGRSIEDRTIERCAQVAENYSNAKPGDISEVMAGDWQAGIAAAIRKLAKPKAAQVGEQITWDMARELNLAKLAIKNDIIERCAQVVKKLGQYSNGEWIDLNIENIYAAILQLKDEP